MPPCFVSNKIILNDLSVLNFPSVAESARSIYTYLSIVNSNPLVSHLASSSVPDNLPRPLKRKWPHELLILKYDLSATIEVFLGNNTLRHNIGQYY